MTRRRLLVVVAALFIALFTLIDPSCGSSLGERDLSKLSTSQIWSLVTSHDPLKNVDPSDPKSHLSKILIPRARRPFVYMPCHCRVLILEPFSWDSEHHHSQELHRLDTSNPEMARRRGYFQRYYTYRRQAIHQYNCHS
jgi:hypothetical protein